MFQWRDHFENMTLGTLVSEGTNVIKEETVKGYNELKDAFLVGQEIITPGIFDL